MRRREFLNGLAAVPGLVALAALSTSEAGAEEDASAAAAAVAGSESLAAFQELQVLLGEVLRRSLGPEWGIRPDQIPEGLRHLMHLLAAATDLYFEADPERPLFKPIVTPWRKFLGDNPDALYHLAPLRGDRRYRIRGNLAGAVYTSFTFQVGDARGVAGRIFATRNDGELQADADGSYELVLGPDATGPRDVKLDPAAVSVTTRHYFENEVSAQDDPDLIVPLRIEPLDDPGPTPPPTDASIARSLRLAAGFVRQNTLDMPPRDPAKQPGWVSVVPNRLGEPVLYGGGEEVSAWGAVDNAYSMGPFLLKPDEALVIEGRLPACRFANVVLWNRFMQTFDYRFRRVSLNRKQMHLQGDRYRIVVAGRDPGVPDWLDTEGRPLGSIFWRFQLPAEQPEQPRTRVVPLAEAARA